MQSRSSWKNPTGVPRLPVAHIGVIRRCANPGAEHLSYPNCHPSRRKPSGHSQFHQPTCFQVRRGTCLSGQQSHISNARNALWHWDRVQPEMAGGSHVALSGLDNFTKCILALAETEQSGANANAKHQLSSRVHFLP